MVTVARRQAISELKIKLQTEKNELYNILQEIERIEIVDYKESFFRKHSFLFSYHDQKGNCIPRGRRNQQKLY